MPLDRFWIGIFVQWKQAGKRPFPTRAQRGTGTFKSWVKDDKSLIPATGGDAKPDFWCLLRDI